MAKTDVPFSSLALWRAYAPPSEPTWLADVKVNGWDTETANGRPFVLSWAFDGMKPDALVNKGDPLSSEDIFAALTHKRARGACNVWYNLDFDANVILAHLPKKVVYRIAMLGTARWNGYEITYLKGKLLSITDKHRNKVEHFDVAHIFFQTGGSLDGALQAWLARRKQNQDVDVKQFGKARYRKKHLADIVKYGKQDAADVRDLWRGFASVAEPLEIPCARPYSTGFLAEQRFNVEFRKPGKRKPGFVNRQLQEAAWKTYRGGRFEVIERGTIEDVVSFDINSAYPNVLRTLPDPGSLHWMRDANPSARMLEDAHYGFIRAVVTTDASRPLQPFAIRRSGRLTFPALHRFEVNVTLPEYLHALRSGLVTQAKIKEAWLGWRDENTVFPFSFIDQIYEKRQQLKRDGNDKAQAVLKIIINSMYGKLAQLTQITEETPANIENWKKHWIWKPTQFLPPHLRQWLDAEGIELHETIKAGAYFNPVLASYVTSLTRLQLLETAITSGIEEDVVLLATDSLTFRARNRASLADDVVHKSRLGAWSFDARGDLFLVGSGVYELKDEESGEVKARTRGFEPGIGVFVMALGGSTLRDAAGSAIYDTEKKEWVVPISNDRPLKIPQALWQNLDLEEVGMWREFPRGLSAGMDRKRLWPKGRHVTYRELLESSERSNPLRWSGLNA